MSGEIFPQPRYVVEQHDPTSDEWLYLRSFSDEFSARAFAMGHSDRHPKVELRIMAGKIDGSGRWLDEFVRPVGQPRQIWHHFPSAS